MIQNAGTSSIKRCTCSNNLHPLLHPAGCIVPCIIVHQISQRSPHVLIQSMRTSFCIYRLMSCQNTVYNYQIWLVDARNVLLGVILSVGGSHSPALFRARISTFRGRNQRFIMECTLRWTIAGYRPQCEVSSKVSQNNVKCAPESGHVKSPNPNSWTMKSPNPRMVDTLRNRRTKEKASILCSAITYPP